MVFNSFSFLLFFAVFLILYWFVLNRNWKVQNVLILAASYFFYAWWDIRFLLLLVGSSFIHYILGIYILRTENTRWQRPLLLIGIFQGIVLLLFFKYFDFFIHSLVDSLHLFNVKVNIHSLNIILPLGISFYTFKGIGYLVDIYNEKIIPTKDPVVFFAYLSFFPTLLSGPIDSAHSFIPQLEKKRVFDFSKAFDGLLQIIWGLFKKLVVADNCASITNHLFDNYASLPASSLLLASFLYAFQLYADFSGYSDMAIGVSKLIGFDVTKNFNFPFFAQNIADFWQRWHISLTSWMTEYVFTPLSFSFRAFGKMGVIIAILLNFILVGFWHGPNWTFIVYGFLHGCYFIPLVIGGGLKKIKTPYQVIPSFKMLANMLGTFTLVMFTLLVFKANNLGQVIDYFVHIFSLTAFYLPVVSNIQTAVVIFLFCCITILIEWFQRDKDHALQFSPTASLYKFYLRGSFVMLIFWSIILWGASGNKTFMYFQF